MAFTNSYRLERVYFEKLKSSIDILKSFLDSETDEKARALLENGIDDNGAILLLYRNLGEAWAELADLIKKAENKIDDVKAQADAYHDELNERIDEVNNYIMAIIRELEQRVTALESRVTSLETRMTAAENAITEIRGIITTIQTAIADHETRIAALEECCEEVQDTISDLETAVQGKQDQLTAGSGIAIDPNTNVISNTAQGATYTVGGGIYISNANKISKSQPLIRPESALVNVSSSDNPEILTYRISYNYSEDLRFFYYSLIANHNLSLLTNRNTVYRLSAWCTGGELAQPQNNGLKIKFTIKPNVLIENGSVGGSLGKSSYIFPDFDGYYYYNNTDQHEDLVHSSYSYMPTDFDFMVTNKTSNSESIVIYGKSNMMFEILENNNNLPAADILDVLDRIVNANHITLTLKSATGY